MIHKRCTALERSVKIFYWKPYFFYLDLSITNGIVSSKINDKQDDFKFEKVNCQLPDVSSSPSYGLNISQLIRFARVCSNADDLNNRSKF